MPFPAYILQLAFLSIVFLLQRVGFCSGGGGRGAAGLARSVVNTWDTPLKIALWQQSSGASLPLEPPSHVKILEHLQSHHSLPCQSHNVCGRS